MVSVKIIFRTDKQNADKEHPFYLRIIKDRRPKYISLGIFLKPEIWDAANKRVKKSYPNSQRMNNYIATKVSEAQGVALKLETDDKNILPEKIKDQIMGKRSESFFKYAERYLEELDYSQKIGTYRHVKSIIGKMKEYTAGKDLLFDYMALLI